jgi:hypothetical protein
MPCTHPVLLSSTRYEILVSWLYPAGMVEVKLFPRRFRFVRAVRVEYWAGSVPVIELLLRSSCKAQKKHHPWHQVVVRVAGHCNHHLDAVPAAAAH